MVTIKANLLTDTSTLEIKGFSCQIKTELSFIISELDLWMTENFGEEEKQNLFGQGHIMAENVLKRK